MASTQLKQRIFKTIASVASATATFGGVYSVIKEVLNPTQTVGEVLSSTAMIIIYILVLIAAISALLYDKYKGLTRLNEELNKKIESLNYELNSASVKLDSALRNGQIAIFKNKFFLTTEKLYSDLADKIYNDITIYSMDISNTIENEGIDDKRDSCVKMSVKGITTQDNVCQMQILIAGDSMVKWEKINFEAYEICNDKRFKLKARIADNGQDSYLKQVVISYNNRKKLDEFFNIELSWRWPNMLSISEDDYVTLPIALSPKTKDISMKLIPKMDLNFSELGIYKYVVGQEKPDLIMDLNEDSDKTISFSDENPQYKSCYIMYYKIAHDDKTV